MDDHTESLQVDFDPAQISFAEIAEVFWKMHNPCATAYSRQYMSAIWYHDQEQKEILEDAANRLDDSSDKPVNTPVSKLGTFYLAEDYHQKYGLQSRSELMKLFHAMYPNFADFNDSVAAARLNGFVTGRGSKTLFELESASYGIPIGQLETVVRFAN